MLLQHTLIIIIGLTSTQTPPISNWVLASCKMADLLLISVENWTKPKKLYHHGKGTPFHCCYSQRILLYAPRCWHSCLHWPQEFKIQWPQNTMCFAMAQQDWIILSLVALHWRQKEHSRWQSLLSPFPPRLGAYCGGNKLVEPAVVTDNKDEDEEAYLMDHDWSGICDINILKL